MTAPAVLEVRYLLLPDRTQALFNLLARWSHRPNPASQTAMAHALGLRKRHTVGLHLRRLERVGLLTREKTWRYLRDGRARRWRDRIHIVAATCHLEKKTASFLSPLQDSCTNVLPKRERHANVGRSQEGRDRKEAVRASVSTGYASQKRFTAGQNLGPQERARLRDLAHHVGQRLLLLAGDRSGREHPSAGFHVLCAYRYGEEVLDKALAACVDLRLRVLARTATVRSYGAYFAGCVRRIAEGGHSTVKNKEASRMDPTA